MSLIHESRERQRLYVPTRASIRTPGADPWRPQGQRPDYTPETRLALPARLAAVVLIGALNLFFPSASPSLQAGILVVDLAGLLILLDTLNKLWYGYRSRSPLLRWVAFPAQTGGRLEAVLVARPSPEVVGPVLAVLRCVQEERGEGGPVMIYSQTAEFDVPGERLKEVTLTFEIPSDLPGTDLDREDPIYWQIAVRIPVVGPDLEFIYLAPVYVPGTGGAGGG